jgi:hypothetical protein
MLHAERRPVARWSSNASDSTAAPMTPSRLAAELLASTTTATATTATTVMSAARADRTTEGVEGATIATIIVIVASRRTKGARVLSVKKCGTRSFPRSPKLRQTSLGTTGDQPERVGAGLPAHVSRRWSDRQSFHHQEPAALPR